MEATVRDVELPLAEMLFPSVPTVAKGIEKGILKALR
jgi:hypothetical protein